VLAWALDLVARGGMVETRAGTMPWRNYFATGELYDDFGRWAGGQRFERLLPRNTFARELTRTFGLRGFRRALVRHVGVPSAMRDQQGYEVPASLREFGKLVRECAGLAGGEEEENEGQELQPAA
jgi:hypothetical protein